MTRDPYARGGMFYSEERRPRPRRSLLAWIVSGIALLLAVAVAASRG